MSDSAVKLLKGAVVVALFAYAVYTAYHIRLYAIEGYGRVIHEFDPWFNYRATEYLANNGWYKFTHWFDFESWYPIGRPVGTTIYPGMQITAVAIWNFLKNDFLRKTFGKGISMSLNDVCVFMPTWFGAIASVFLGLLAREVSGSWLAGGFSAVVMAIIPAHLMRSIGGGFDNESVAMSAMCATFYFWTRSLRNKNSWWIGVIAGLAYAYMVAAWGGFIFVSNMVALHAFVLVLLGKYTTELHKAYSLWYIVGTIGALQIPIVGLSPFKSMEQIAALLVFFGLNFLAFVRKYAHARNITWDNNRSAFIGLHLKFAIAVASIASLPLMYLASTGYFGPLSVRVRSLFIKHTKTGNPLVDSVAEHQPASANAYWTHLHNALFLAPVGLAYLFFLRLIPNPKDTNKDYKLGVSATKWFIILYAAVAYYFANKMSRLIILLGPVASVLGGVAIDFLLHWILRQADRSTTIISSFKKIFGLKSSAPAATSVTAPSGEKKKDEKEEKSKDKSKEKEKEKEKVDEDEEAEEILETFPAGARAGLEPFVKLYTSPIFLLLRAALAGYLAFIAPTMWFSFQAFSDGYAHQISHPSIMYKGTLRDGTTVMVNDYQESYWWLKKNTATDARILSWWDYGYQISGIGNRTTLADGNTWNLEHIALIGRMLTSPEKKAHALARHLADYVLIWTGNRGDDLAKSPHMARIGNSVFGDLCPNDPLCKSFGFTAQRQPTPSMAASLLFKLHSGGLVPGVTVNDKLFELVYQSKYGLVRIYKILDVDLESKAWIEDPKNRKCDESGWICPGQYPPKLPIKPPTTHKNINYDDPSKFREEL